MLGLNYTAPPYSTLNIKYETAPATPPTIENTLKVYVVGGVSNSNITLIDKGTLAAFSRTPGLTDWPTMDIKLLEEVTDTGQTLLRIMGEEKTTTQTWTVGARLEYEIFYPIGARSVLPITCVADEGSKMIVTFSKIGANQGLFRIATPSMSVVSGVATKPSWVGLLY